MIYRVMCGAATSLIFCEQEAEDELQAVERLAGAHLEHSLFTILGYYRNPLSFHTLKWQETFKVEEDMSIRKIARVYIPVPREGRKKENRVKKLQELGMLP